MQNPAKAWLLAFRPKTLTAAFVPILVATAWSWHQTGQIQWWISALALLASTFIQIGTNLINDAVDYQKGADTAERLGPIRVTASGRFSSFQVFLMGGLMFALAILCGVPLVREGGWPILAVGILSLLLGYGYTGGPFPLAYKGLGDVFVILFFGLVAVGGLSYLHLKSIGLPEIILGLQIGFHCTVLIAINNLRDVAGDTKVNKKTLAVRFGIKFARGEILFLCLAPFLLGAYWWSIGIPKAFLIPLLALPLALKIPKLVFKTEPSAAYNRFLGMSAGLHLIFGILLSVGLIL